MNKAWKALSVVAVMLSTGVLALPSVANAEEKPAEVRVLFSPSIRFSANSSKLEPDQLAPLYDIVKAMLSDKVYSVKIQGHSSFEGKDKYNNEISQKRAEVVRDFLIANGVAGNRLTAIGFGSKVPISDNQTEAGRAANRRVEFDVIFVIVKK